MFITALPTIAQMVGANRILRGVSITHPTGDPSLAAGDELELRVRILDRALAMLETEVAPAHRVGDRRVSSREPRSSRPRSSSSTCPTSCDTGRSRVASRRGGRRSRASLRTFDDAVAYPPNQVFIGNLRPEDLWDRPRPWWKQPVDDASPEGSSGDIGTQAAFYERCSRRTGSS